MRLSVNTEHLAWTRACAGFRSGAVRLWDLDAAQALSNERGSRLFRVTLEGAWGLHGRCRDSEGAGFRSGRFFFRCGP